MYTDDPTTYRSLNKQQLITIKARNAERCQKQTPEQSLKKLCHPQATAISPSKQQAPPTFALAYLPQRNLRNEK